MTRCPSDEELGTALGATVGDGSADAVMAHVEVCAACQTRVETRLAEDGTLGELRALGERPHPTVRAADPGPAPRGLEDFEIRRELHRGGQGVVYAAADRQTGRTVALKTLRSGGQASTRELSRFEREMQIAAGLNHPNIVTLYHAGRTPDGQLFFVMELVDGVDVVRYCETRQPQADPVRERLELFVKICAPVAYAHANGVVHRDLKPSNILIDDEGEPHLLDFGLAKSVDVQGRSADGMTQSLDFVGTLAWAAPEQTPWVDAAPDRRTDVYALGLILYHLLTGEHPYPTEGTPLAALRAVVDGAPRPPSAHLPGHANARDLDAVILKALEKDPRHRYDGVDDLAEDCRRLAAGEPVRARRPGTVDLALRTIRRHRVLSLVAVGLGIAAVVALGVVRSRAEARERREVVAVYRALGDEGIHAPPGEDLERAAWRELLSGRAGALDPERAAGGFPAPPAVLRTLRGAYARAPILATHQVAARTPWRTDPTTGRFIGVTTGDATAAQLPNPVPVYVLEPTDLRLRRYELDLPGLVELDVTWDGRWYAHSSVSGLHALEPPSTGLSIRKSALPPGAAEVVYVGANTGIAEGLEREILAACTEPGGAAKVRVHWLRRPDAAVVLRDQVNLGVELWRHTAEGWSFAGRAPRSVVAFRFDQEVRLCFPPGAPADDAWTEFLVPGEGVDFSQRIESMGISLDGGVRVQVVGRELVVMGAGGAGGVTARLGIFRQAPISRAIVDANGKLLVCSSIDGLTRIVDLPALDGGEPLCVTEAGEPRISLHSVARSSRPGGLAVAGTDFRAPGVDVGARAAVRAPGGGVPWRFSPDWVARRSGSELVDEGEFLTGAVFLPGNEDHVLLAGTDAELFVWAYLEADAGLVPLERLGAPGGPSRRPWKYNDLSVHASTGRVAAASQEGSVHLLEFDPGVPFQARERVVDATVEFPPPTTQGLFVPERISCVAWSPDGRGLVAGRGDGSILWIDAEDASLARARPEAMAPVDHVRGVAVGRGPEGVLVATAWDDHGVGLWRWGASEPDVVLEHDDRVLAVAFGADASVLYTGTLAGQVRVWDLASWRDEPPVCVAKLDVEPAALLDLAGTDEDGVFLTGGQQSGLKRWDLSAFDRHVAGNLAFWSEELADEADPEVVRELSAWAEGVLERAR